MRCLAAVLLLLAGQARADACRPEGAVAALPAPPYSAIILPEGGPEIGVLFSMDIVTCDAGWRVIDIDTRMPAHGHGMNYEPRITSTENGARAMGLMFHMPGLWEVSLVLTDGITTRETIAKIDVAP